MGKSPTGDYYENYEEGALLRRRSLFLWHIFWFWSWVLEFW
jgi:hypothetical protein